MIRLVYLVPLFPFLGFLINGLGRQTFSKHVVGFIGSLMILISFALSVGIFLELNASELKSITITLFNWIQVDTLIVPFSFLVDPLSALMLLIVTGIGFLIHVYSIGYMHSDVSFGKFFSYLNLFIFFMLLLVLGSNYLILFIGWEGVGLCSYLLIGFWYSHSAYVAAAKKAFVMNRIGDLGFLLAIFLIFDTFGSLEFAHIFPQAADMFFGSPSLLLITILLFIGATGKSAQIPLFTWLPDAMAGPTPVSALIHAATMVTAGIYLIVRSNILFTLAPITLEIVALVGLSTAFLAASIALMQTDIKKILAYSTISQLGYMFLGLGVGAYTGAFFHLMTHAFFKALLFLGAGSVIHAMSNGQDIRHMGGLRRKLPITFLTMLVGTIAIAGIPPFAGFFSKDEILAYVYQRNPYLWIIAVIAAMFTVFYMFRLLFLTFYGNFRGTKEQAAHLHESPGTMAIPLILLAVLSVFGGFLGVPEIFGGNHFLANFLAPIFPVDELRPIKLSLSHHIEYILMAVSIGAVLIAFMFAYIKYVRNASIPLADKEKQHFLTAVVYHKYYVDELYSSLITQPLAALSRFFYAVVDRFGIDGIVNGLGKGVVAASKDFRLLQTGNIAFYVFMMILGTVSLLIYSFF